MLLVYSVLQSYPVMLRSLLVATVQSNSRQSRYPLATVAMNRIHPFLTPSRDTSTTGPPPTTPKPPNVLIFQWCKDSTNVEFVRTKAALEKCLSTERYAIYPLGFDDIDGSTTTPWKDNCKLVVVPPDPGRAGCDQLSPKVIRELVSYLIDGGFLLSMNAHLSRCFGLKNISQKTADINCTLEDESKLSPDSGVGGVTETVGFHAITLKSRDNHVINEQQIADKLQHCISSRVPIAHFESSSEDQNTNQCNNVPGLQSAVELVCVNSGGCAVVSSVDLLPLPEGETDIPLLIKLKRDVMVRSTVLGRLLGLLGLECSEGGVPNHTHSYLVCQEKVGHLHAPTFLCVL